jgi:hypothetical protein
MPCESYEDADALPDGLFIAVSERETDEADAIDFAGLDACPFALRELDPDAGVHPEDHGDFVPGFHESPRHFVRADAPGSVGCRKVLVAVEDLHETVGSVMRRVGKGFKETVITSEPAAQPIWTRHGSAKAIMMTSATL